MKPQPWDGMNPKAGPQIIPAFRVHAVPIDSIRPQERNPRLGDVPVIQGSLRIFGMRRVATVRPGGEITAGSTMWRAAKAEGMTHIAAVVIHDDTPAEARAWSMADNRSHDVGTYDDKLLDDELEQLARDAPELLSGAGYDLDAVIASFHLDELDLEDDDDPSTPYVFPGGRIPDHQASTSGPRVVKPHQLDRIPEDDGDPGPTPPPPSGPAPSPRPPAAVDTAPDNPPDKTGPDIGDHPATAGYTPPAAPDIPDDSPTVLLHAGDLRILITRDAWTRWRTEWLNRDDGDRHRAAVSMAVALGFDLDDLVPYPTAVPPTDRRMH